MRRRAVTGGEAHHVLRSWALALAVTLTLGGCVSKPSDLYDKPGGMSFFPRIKPGDLEMELPPNVGSPVYRMAFNDGCQSGYGAMALPFYKPFLKWKQDPDLAQRDEYYLVWQDAYSYCAMFAMTASSHAFGNFR